MQNGHGNPRIMTETAHPPVSWVEGLCSTRRLGERKVCAVIIADPFSQRAITDGGPKFFDPWVLIRRDSLVGQLASNPMCFLGQDDPTTKAGCRYGRRAGTQASPDNGYISA